MGWTGAVDATTARIARLAERWSGQRTERQARRSLDRADFDALEDAGFLRSAGTDAAGRGVEVGRVLDTSRLRRTARALALADPSVTLVAAMHPAVLGLLAHDGALRSVEPGDGAAGLAAGLRAKTAIAELGEGSVTRIARVLGGGTFSR